MSGLCGVFAAQPEEQVRDSLRRMLAANQPPVQGADVKVTEQVGLAAFATPARPHLLEHDGFLLAFAGHPRLGDGPRRNSDPHALLQALRERGKAALQAIGGDFALAAWDSRKHRGLIAIDRIGVQTLVYGRAGEALAFASTLDMLGGCPGMRRELSNQGLYDYLFYHVSPGPGTVLADLKRLEPGCCLEFHAGAAGEPAPYWSIRFSEDNHRDVASLKDEFVGLLQAAVAEAAAGAASGAFLSGGTDSSTVSGMMARAGSGPAQTFSIGFDVAGYDEMEYARIAADHFACEHHAYYVTPDDVVSAVPKIAAAYDQPFGNASAVPTYYCAKLAREHGIERLLAGDGGDELFGGNERYAKHHLLGQYQRIPLLLRRSLIEPLLLAAPGLRGAAPLRKLRSYIEQARPPMPERYLSYNLLNHLGIAEVFTHEFLATIDSRHPQVLLARAHAAHAGASLVNQMQAIDLRFILADGDLPKVTRMCELAGVDVAFPLLDERVVAFSQGLAADLKLRGTTLRWFFKQALIDFLPPAVISKKKHGFGLPVGTWLVSHPPLNDLARAGIDLLRHRGIVRPGFIDELLTARLREHPAYFGTMVWVLMMLGLWLDSRKL